MKYIYGKLYGQLLMDRTSKNKTLINLHGEVIQKSTNIRFCIYKNFKFPKSEKMKIQKLKTKESESKNRLSETTTF